MAAAKEDGTVLEDEDDRRCLPVLGRAAALLSVMFTSLRDRAVGVMPPLPPVLGAAPMPEDRSVSTSVCS